MSRSRKGFTLVELLIVVVIIGILAAVAIPKFADTREKAYLSAMRSDLKRSITVAESFFAENGTYAAFPLDSASPGVTLTRLSGDARGWSAQATSVNTTKTCKVYVGTAATTASKPEGVPTCE